MNLSADLDDLLRDTLHDDRLALPVPARTLDVVRRKRRTRQRLTVAGTAVCAVALVGGGLLLAAPGGSAARLSPYADGGVPAGSAAPGISPAFVPTSGRDWLLTAEEYASWSAQHTRPSPPPGQSTVSSPAPLVEQSATLAEAVRGSALPASAVLRREDSVGGQPGVAAVHIVLADGTPVEVESSQAHEPFAYALNGIESTRLSDEPGAHVVDVPGTDAAAGVLPTAPYGLPGVAGPVEGVVLVTRSGLVTSWHAPSTVPLSELQSWAFAAAQHAGD